MITIGGYDMNDQLLEFLGNPIIAQILLEFEQSGELSPKTLLSKLPDVPQATLYRYINKLHKNDILKISSEKQKRGTIEKTYSLNAQLSEKNLDKLTEITPQQYFDLFSKFTVGLLKEFNAYSKNEEANIIEDGTGFSTVPIYATADELKKYSQEIKKILEPALIKSEGKQRRHNFVMIVTPPKDGDNIEK